MKSIVRNLFLGCFLLIFVGCYDDKGNYDYSDVNEVEITLPPYSVRLSKSETVSVVLEPEITQTLAEDESNLTFKWEKLDMSEALNQVPYEECGNEKTLTLEFGPEDQSRISVRLTVTDNRPDGTIWFRETSVSPILPYNATWFVLQDDGGKSVLGAVDGNGEGAVVIPDVYKTDVGTDFPLVGSPKMIKTFFQWGGLMSGGYSRVLFVSTDQDAGIYNSTSFDLIYSWKDLLLYKNMVGESNYVPKEMWSSMTAGHLLTNDEDEIYLANADNYAIFHPLGWSSSVEEREMRITHAAPSHAANWWFLYDDLNHCFLYSVGRNEMMEAMFNNPGYRGSGIVPTSPYNNLSNIRNNASAPNVFEPTLADGDVVLSMDAGAGGSRVFATTYSPSSGKYVVYEFNGNGFESASEAICCGRYEFDLPGANYNEVSVAMSSYGYERGIQFVAYGNKVYRVELTAIPRVILVYEHPDAMVKIKKLKFKYGDDEFSYGEDPSDWQAPIYSYEYYWSLGALVDYGDNTGGVIDMKLNAAGEIDRDEPVVEHKGFGKVVDFSFCGQTNLL